MKYLGVLLATSLSLSAFAHDEGHGPKLTEGGKMGGVMTAVVLAKHAKLGAKAPLVYKAELTRADDGTVRIYFYDTEMKPLNLDGFPKTATAALQAKRLKKWTSTPFILNKGADGYEGKTPKPASKPFNIDVTVKAGKRELLAAFDGLD